MNETQTTKREFGLFAAMAFGLPLLMMLPLWMGYRAGADNSGFANVQMFYPAAGVMLAFWLCGRPGLPKRFFGLHLAGTILLMVLALLSVFSPSPSWPLYSNLLIIALSLAGWALLLTEKKPKRQTHGLCWQGSIVRAMALCGLFLALKTGMIFLSMALEGAESFAAYLSYWASPVPWLNLLILVPNFFLAFLPFLGEEYGWRYYMTPALQKRFGLRKGLLLTGAAWGLWHLPLNLFFYSPDTSLQSIASQLVVCVTMGVFFSFCYETCGRNIWVPVLLHYLNNNMILVWAGTADISNQVLTWSSVAQSAVMYILCFMPFLAARCFRDKSKTAS